MSLWRATLAKALELTGLIVIGVALYLGVTRDDMELELQTLLYGVVVFGVGWLIEGGSRD